MTLKAALYMMPKALMPHFNGDQHKTVADLIRLAEQHLNDGFIQQRDADKIQGYVFRLKASQL